MTGRERHLVLVGLMGAGKTSVGTECARRLGRRFVDIDEVIEAAAGTTVAEVFAGEGEDGFRRREREAVEDVCASPEPLVIASGGGSVLDGGSRAALRDHGLVVWLTAPAAILAARLSGKPTRPLLDGGDPERTLSRLASSREPAYAAAADIDVDTTNRTVAQVAEICVRELVSWNG